MIYLYIAIALLHIGVLIYLWVKKKKDAAKKSDENKEQKGTFYERERNIALNINPTLLKLKIPEDEILVYGMVMDMDMGDGFMTLACYITGAANLLFSSGGGIKGGGRNPRVGEAGVEFVTDAQEFLYSTAPIKAPLLPSKGIIQFYFLTNKGKYFVQERVASLEDNSSPWLPLFEKGSAVISEMHKTSN